MSNVDSIEGLGDLPYRLAKPILMVMSAEKLAQIEKNSPVCHHHHSLASLAAVLAGCLAMAELWHVIDEHIVICLPNASND